MPKKGGADAWAIGAVLFAGAAIIYAYSKSGRGQENSPVIPDSIEDRMDRVVEALNRQFGQQWVTFGFNAVQAYIERTMPAVTALVNAVFRVEQAYGAYAGVTKKREALRLARGY